MIFKIEKNKNYTVMSNYHLRDKNLSLKAKGLLSFMLSLPETWDYSLNGLSSVSKESKKAIRTILNELKENGYFVMKQTRGKKGYYKYEYIIYEIPIEIQKQKNNPYTQKGYAVQGDAEKVTQINTNKQNNKKQIDKLDKIDKTTSDIENNSFTYDNNHHQLTNDLIKRGYIDKNDTEKDFYDSLFNEVLEKNDFKDIVIISHYIISKVIARKFYDEDNNIIQNKFGYYKSSLLNNIKMLKMEGIEWDEELGWFKEIDDELER